LDEQVDAMAPKDRHPTFSEIGRNSPAEKESREKETIKLFFSRHAVTRTKLISHDPPSRRA
jgi:hypothetical protein